MRNNSEWLSVISSMDIQEIREYFMETEGRPTHICRGGAGRSMCGCFVDNMIMIVVMVDENHVPTKVYEA